MMRDVVQHLDFNGEYCVDNPGRLFTSCLTLGRGAGELELEIRVGEPIHFVPVAEAVMRLVSRIEPLVSTYTLYDIAMNGVIGTHDNMHRRLARLRKLHRIVVAMGDYKDRYWIDADDVFAPVLDLLGLVIDAMESFRNSVRRVRDRVHEFVYPLLRRSLDVLVRPVVVYAMESDDGTSVWITATPYATYRKPKRQQYTIEPRYELGIQNRRIYRTWYMTREQALRFTMEMQRRRCRRYPWLSECRSEQIPDDELATLIDWFLETIEHPLQLDAWC